jgi:hypothetical protein
MYLYLGGLVLVLCPLEVLCYEYYLYKVIHDAVIICRFSCEI